jgi:hypothetical protein
VREPLVRDVGDLGVGVEVTGMRRERTARPIPLRRDPAVELRIGRRIENPAGGEEGRVVDLVVRAGPTPEGPL